MVKIKKLLNKKVSPIKILFYIEHSILPSQISFTAKGAFIIVRFMRLTSFGYFL